MPESITKAIAIVKGDAQAIREVMADESSTPVAWGFLVISSIAAVPLSETAGVSQALECIGLAYVFFGIWFSSIHLVGRLYSTTMPFLPFLRVASFITINTWVGLLFFPYEILFFVGLAYTAYTLVCAVQEVYQVERSVAVIVTSIGTALCLAVILIAVPIALVPLGVFLQAR